MGAAKTGKTGRQIGRKVVRLNGNAKEPLRATSPRAENRLKVIQPER